MAAEAGSARKAGPGQRGEAEGERAPVAWTEGRGGRLSRGSQTATSQAPPLRVSKNHWGEADAVLVASVVMTHSFDEVLR